MNDPDSVLVQHTENAQAGRQIRFNGVRQIEEMEPVLKVYIGEAIAVEQSGMKVDFKQTEEFCAPEDLKQKWSEIPASKTAFDGLSPGRRRADMLYFSAPKQAKTRASRVEKTAQNILDGKGLKD